MSEYEQFLLEREQIDDLLQKGYKIKNVTEGLSGDLLLFEKNMNSAEEKTAATLLILTPKARKYFAVKVIEQAQEKNQRREKRC